MRVSDEMYNYFHPAEPDDDRRLSDGLPVRSPVMSDTDASDDCTAQESPVVPFPWLAPAVVSADTIASIRDYIEGETIPEPSLRRIQTRVMAAVDPPPMCAWWFDPWAA